MAEARIKDAWSRTSSLMALLANVNRDPKKHRPFKPSDFAPAPGSGEPEKVEVSKAEGFDVMKTVFVKNHRNARRSPHPQLQGGTPPCVED